MADILNDIDEAIARNSKRFDPFGGEAWDEDRVGHGSHADSMRVYAPRTGIEEEVVPVDAVPGSLLDLADHLDRMLAEEAVEGVRRHLTGDELAAISIRAAVRDAYGHEEPDGSAPTDRVADAFRAEVRRQGLAPCEIEIDGRTEWLNADPALHWCDNCCGVSPETCTYNLAARVEAFRQEETLWADPGAAHVDAALEPNPVGPCGNTVPGMFGAVLVCERSSGHDGPHGDGTGCQWTPRDWKVPLPAEPQASAAAPRPWWKRLLP